MSAANIDPILKTILSTMTRLHAEIMRSISHYRSQQAGNAPSRIYLCGGTSSTPHLRDFFADIVGRFSDGSAEPLDRAEKRSAASDPPLFGPAEKPR